MKQVVAVIVERDGATLACRRRADQAHALKWEFPGGKVEPGETPEQAGVRELREELGVEVSGCDELARYAFTYPGKAPIELIFLRARSWTGEPANLIFDRIEWARPADLPAYDFLEGDLPFLATYSAGRPDDSARRPYTGAMSSGIKMADPAALPFLAELEAKSGRANHFFRTMANRPKVLEGFVPLYGAIMGAGPLERRTKELAYLTVSYANGCVYCKTAHVASGRKAGITEAEMQAIEGEQDSAFSGAELAAVRYARELTRTADAKQTRAALREFFSDEQIAELTLVVAMANFTNRFNNGLELRPES